MQNLKGKLMDNFIVSKYTVIAVFLIFVLFIIIIALSFFRKTKSAEGYILGSRETGGFTAGLSSAVGDFGGWIFAVIPCVAFSSVSGAKTSIYMSAGIAAGMFLCWTLIAGRLRVYSELSGNSMTIPSFLENRFKDKSGALRIASSSALVLFSVMYASFMLYAGAQMFMRFFNFSLSVALFICVSICVVSLFLGGHPGSCHNNVLLSILISAALIFMPVFIFQSFDFNRAAAFGKESESILNLLPVSFLDTEPGNISLSGILSSLSWILACFGMPFTLNSFMSLKSRREVRKARSSGVIWLIACLTGVVFAAIMMRRYIPVTENSFILSDTLNLFGDTMFKTIIFSAAVLAFIASASANISVCVNTLSYDIFPKLSGGLSRRDDVRTFRGSIILVCALVYVFAAAQDKTILELSAHAYSGFGAAFGPVILLSLYTRRITAKGAVGSVITGTLTVILFQYILSPRFGGVFNISELTAGFVLSALALIIISALDSKKADKYILDEFGRMEAIMKCRGQFR